MNQNYVTIRDVARRRVVATENFLFGYYRSSIHKIKLWKVSNIFGGKVSLVSSEKLKTAFQQFSGWSFERCISGVNQNHLYLLIQNEWQRRTLEVDLRNQQIVSNTQGWVLAVSENIRINSLANVEDSIFGHDMLDIRINGQIVPIDGYKLDWERILIHDQMVGLFYSVPGSCDEKFALIKVQDDDMKIVSKLNLSALESFDLSDFAEVSWYLSPTGKSSNHSLIRIGQWTSGRKLSASFLMLSDDLGTMKPSAIRQVDHVMAPEVQKLSRQIDDIMWETGCGDHDAEMIEMKSRLDSIVGFHKIPAIEAHNFIMT